MRTFTNTVFFLFVMSSLLTFLVTDFYHQKGLRSMCKLERIEHHVSRLTMDRYERFMNTLELAQSAYNEPEKSCKWYQ
jgi:hypothetical protein